MWKNLTPCLKANAGVDLIDFHALANQIEKWNEKEQITGCSERNAGIKKNLLQKEKSKG